MNILLTSVGRRSYLIKYFKDALGKDGQVHVSNSSSLTPAFSYADQYVKTPLIYDKNYIPFLLNYCEVNKIKAIISLFDIDLPILSTNKHLFEKIGTKIIVSNESVISVCNDKLETYRFLISNGFNAPKTFNTLENALNAIADGELQYPLIIKPRWGMGSIGLYEAENELELKVLYNKVMNNIKNSYLKYESNKRLQESVLVQEKICGQEYGLDIINDLNGQYQNTVVKKKHSMRAGETDCAETVESPILKELGHVISRKLKHIANLDVDVFLTKDKPYILEMNARFGGGYPFSYVAGVNLPLAIIKWLNGEEPHELLMKERIGVLSHKDINIVNIEKPKELAVCDNFQITRIESNEDIGQVLKKFDSVFNPSITDRIEDLEQYSNKLREKGLVYVAKDKEVIGFIAFYANDLSSLTAYLTFIGVHPFAQKRKVGKSLLDYCIKISKEKGMSSLKLEVQKSNQIAINFYKKNGFIICGEASKESYYMIKNI